MQTRREFLKQASIGGGLLALGSFPFVSLAGDKIYHLTILHTNDTHSRMDPIPMDGSKYQGMGGVSRRATLIDSIRSTQENVLLFDAGDIFQGTPYFNLYKGEVEIKAMSRMKYDASTMGNHDFDAGLEGFARQLPFANFPFLVSNYNFERTILKDMIQSYKIFKAGGLRIGVFGLGIQLYGLVPAEGYGKIKYLNPIQIANEVSRKLKKSKSCDLVVCLSHLGFEYNSNQVSDVVIARETECIDLIIGGHTHTFLSEPRRVQNKIGKEVIINQVGWGGINLGRLDFFFDSKKNTKLVKAQTVIIGKETIV